MDRPHLEQALLSLRPFEQEMIELLPHAAYQTVPGSAEVVQHPPDHRIKRRGYFLQRLVKAPPKTATSKSSKFGGRT